MSRYPELLAPAGSMEALIAAVRCGADAVYIGSTQFSARQNAHNFDREAMQQAATFCHLHGVKLYLTVNTIVFDSEWPAFVSLIQDAAACGIDACIVQDIGAAAVIQQLIPTMPLHASTQMTIHSPAGAEWAKAHGFSRVVVAREMTRTEIQQVCACGLEVEQFVHGALCMSISGQCYLSAMIGSRSANRGNCAQACRLPFSACGDPNAAALSLKDLCLLPHYEALCADGIASLKIEGRMKRPEYVAAAVTALRQLRDGKQPDLETLRAVFSRSGFTDGYYTGNRTQMFGTRQKEDVTAATAVLPKLAELYRKEIPHVPLHLHVSVVCGQPVTLTASIPAGRITVTGAVAEQAKTKPCDADFLTRQLGKLGDTIYILDKLIADCDGVGMLPASALNALRRSAVAELNALQEHRNTPVHTIASSPTVSNDKCITHKPSVYWVQVQTEAQLQQVLEQHFPAAHILLPLALAEQLPSVLADGIVTLPRFAPDDAALQKRLHVLRNAGWKDLLCDNTAQIILGKEAGFRLHGGMGLNIANRHSIQVLRQEGLEHALLSPELTLAQGTHCCGILPIGMYVYGHIPVMHLRACPIREEVGCRACKHRLTDRTGRIFPVLCNEGYSTMYNAVPVWMADQLQRLPRGSIRLLAFTIETPQQVSNILSAYQNGGKNAPKEYTRGLLMRGVQ